MIKSISRLVCIALLIVGAAAPAFAQDPTDTPTPAVTDTPTPSDTPTPTDTPTDTPTPTPDVIVYWTMPAPDVTATGTPGTLVPGQGQAVAVDFTMTLDGIVDAIELFMLIVTLLIIFTVWLLRPKR